MLGFCAESGGSVQDGAGTSQGTSRAGRGAGSRADSEGCRGCGVSAAGSARENRGKPLPPRLGDRRSLARDPRQAVADVSALPRDHGSQPFGLRRRSPARDRERSGGGRAGLAARRARGFRGRLGGTVVAALARALTGRVPSAALRGLSIRDTGDLRASVQDEPRGGTRRSPSRGGDRAARAPQPLPARGGVAGSRVARARGARQD